MDEVSVCNDSGSTEVSLRCNWERSTFSCPKYTEQLDELRVFQVYERSFGGAFCYRLLVVFYGQLSFQGTKIWVAKYFALVIWRGFVAGG